MTLLNNDTRKIGRGYKKYTRPIISNTFINTIRG